MIVLLENVTALLESISIYFHNSASISEVGLAPFSKIKGDSLPFQPPI